jgi:hypothetical protein
MGMASAYYGPFSGTPMPIEGIVIAVPLVLALLPFYFIYKGEIRKAALSALFCWSLAIVTGAIIYQNFFVAKVLP